MSDRHITGTTNSAARAAIERVVTRWQEGSEITPEGLLHRAQRIQQSDQQQYPGAVEMQDVLNEIEMYEVMGWIEVRHGTDGLPVITGVRPIVARQSAIHRGNNIGNQLDRQERRAHRQADEATYGEALAELGISDSESVETLAAKLQQRGLFVRMHQCFPMTSCAALVAFVRDGTPQDFRGVGDTESQAICFAAAAAYLAQRDEGEA